MISYIDEIEVKKPIRSVFFFIPAAVYSLLVALESTRLIFLVFLATICILMIFLFRQEWIIPAIFASLFIPFSINVVGIYLHPADFLLSFFFILFTFNFFLNAESNYKIFPYFKPVILFVIAAVLSLTKARNIYACLSDIIQIIELYIIGGLIFINYLNDKLLRQIVLICIVGTLLQNLFVVSAIVSGERFWGWTGSLFPYLSIFVALVTYHGIIYFQGRSRLIWFVAFIIIWIGLLASGTRSAWIATVVGIFYANYLKNPRSVKKTILFVILIIFLIIVLGPPSMSERIQSIVDPQYFSNVSRFYLMYSAWNAFIESPITGIGIKNFPQQLPDFLPSIVRYLPNERKQTILQEISDGAGAHNMYFAVLGELGLVGFLAICCLMFMSIRDAHGNLKPNQTMSSKFKNSCIGSSLISFYIMAFFVPGIHVRIEFTLFWVLLLALIKKESSRL